MTAPQFLAPFRVALGPFFLSSEAVCLSTRVMPTSIKTCKTFLLKDLWTLRTSSYNPTFFLCSPHSSLQFKGHLLKVPLTDHPFQSCPHLHPQFLSHWMFFHNTYISRKNCSKAADLVCLVHIRSSAMEQKNNKVMVITVPWSEYESFYSIFTALRNILA